MARLTVAELLAALEGADPGAEVVIARDYDGMPIAGAGMVGARFELDIPDAKHLCDCAGCTEGDW